MARSMWKGAIQFGLVTIPIKLYLATESSYQVRFNMLHEKDLSRIQMKTYCPVDDEVISRTDTVKGYEYAPDKYVVVTDEDLEKVPLKTVRTIEIEQFTKADPEDSNTRFVKQAYYIEPDKIGRKAFYLLRSVLQDEGLTAICKVVIKDREALAAMDPFGDTMLLTTLHWPDEIRSTKELDLPDDELDFKPAELAMATAARVGDDRRVRAEKYHDEYRDALLKVIEAKVEGHEVEEVEPVEETGNPGRPDGRPRGVGQGQQGRPRGPLLPARAWASETYWEITRRAPATRAARVGARPLWASALRASAADHRRLPSHRPRLPRRDPAPGAAADAVAGVAPALGAPSIRGHPPSGVLVAPAPGLSVGREAATQRQRLWRGTSCPSRSGASPVVFATAVVVVVGFSLGAIAQDTGGIGRFASDNPRYTGLARNTRRRWRRAGRHLPLEHRRRAVPEHGQLRQRPGRGVPHPRADGLPAADHSRAPRRRSCSTPTPPARSSTSMPTGRRDRRHAAAGAVRARQRRRHDLGQPRRGRLLAHRRWPLRRHVRVVGGQLCADRDRDHSRRRGRRGGAAQSDTVVRVRTRKGGGGDGQGPPDPQSRPFHLVVTC